MTDKEKKSKKPAAPKKDPTANLAELIERAHGANVDEYKQTIQRMQEELEYVRAELDEQHNEAMSTMTFLKAELARKDAQLAQLNDELSADRAKYAQSRKEQETAADLESTSLREMIVERDKQIKDQEDELDTLNEFKQQRQAYLAEVEQLKSQLAEADRQLQDKISRLESKFYSEKLALQKEFAAKLLEAKKQSHETAMARLGDATKTLFVENQQMTDEIHKFSAESDKWKKVRQRLEDDNKKLQRDCEMYQVSIKEYAKVALQRKQKIRKLHQTTQELEAQVATLNERLVAEARNEKPAASTVVRQLEDYKLDCEGLRKLLEIKGRETRKIKRLARMILEQRTDLEQFFLDALDEVKAELLISRQRAARQETQPLPDIGPKQSPGRDSLSSSQRLPSPPGVAADAAAERTISVKDLGWEEKEKVLRLLFSKMKGTY
eukprot:TRINITY_DN23050_c0_g1_i1.p1 TRINITY_DN23050_c0_g1~~TRINITY_DN23050_c0_g1_i1.p1  ORF type:complete len:438 (+),score=170.08 TRINITY_DN23050_c0_g1_i1:236-1549(+)